ncbi:DUF2219 family protein [Helicobacter saguini]|uniref:DUF2219 family protein n=1 Tax=Helicobacter saguini TaxID=1548018 RepID=A0A6B0HYI0_9HELI|nr:lipid A deacylase LpxR family protein [Helicobacter saguini]MWV61987.1 DUF2219 family protein [Helicobacter saguini]MWV67339.1 DUF2219 family protein [Helicobacter saguini]MWV69690.1 DUF2219 family protein [Helicobacter saguini]MWV73092.1 DUF2219 family protein [Helicobacter saguini]
MKICILVFLLFGVIFGNDFIESNGVTESKSQDSNIQDSKDSKNTLNSQNLDSKDSKNSQNFIESTLQIPYKKRTITLITDNDAYFPITDKDRYYTAGHSLTYTHSEREDSILRFIGFAWLIEKKSKNLDSKNIESKNKDFSQNTESNLQDSKKDSIKDSKPQNIESKTQKFITRFHNKWQSKPISRYAFSAAQEINTPHNKFAIDTPRDDLPYSGYLYLSAMAQNRIHNFLEQTSVNIGVVGPYALGRETQDSIHDSLNVGKYPGWNYQLQNEPIFNLYYKAAYKMPILPSFIEAIPRTAIALGNAHTHLDLALNLRAGYGVNGDFGFSYARNSGFNTTSINNAFRIYAQLDILARLVARNIFIQGNTFGGLQTNLALNPLIYELNIGALCAWKGFSLGLNYTIRSQEFSTQIGSDNFATFRLEISF